MRVRVSHHPPFFQMYENNPLNTKCTKKYRIKVVFFGTTTTTTSKQRGLFFSVSSRSSKARAFVCVELLSSLDSSPKKHLFYATKKREKKTTTLPPLLLCTHHTTKTHTKTNALNSEKKTPSLKRRVSYTFFFESRIPLGIIIIIAREQRN